jgi:wyosine [tRNA(Phe)-imidazoG37] synthetase (radical SAM superfamily)
MPGGLGPRLDGRGPVLKTRVVILDVYDHSRDSAGLRYVYPVVSRRAKGVSVGINLNPNNACNYRCIYCQVPGLTAGGGPAIELPRLRDELRALLTSIVHGDFMTAHVPEGARTLRDVAFSGNGEPTTSPDFEAAANTVLAVLNELALLGKLKIVLITNGTRVGQPGVLRALARLAPVGGEVWYKLDSATDAGTRAINQHAGSMGARLARLVQCADVCPTKLQTCVFAFDGKPPSDEQRAAYLACVSDLVARGTPLRGVLVYGVARPSHQPEASRISQVPAAWAEAFVRDIAACGLPVELSL